MTNSRITYSAKEILARIEKQQIEGFARIEAVQAQKADKSDINRLEKTIESHADRLSYLEVRQAHDDATSAATDALKTNSRNFKQWAIPVLVSIALVIVSIVH